MKKVKEESEKAGLKLSIRKTKIMVYSAITSWQTEGEKVETMTDFIFLDTKITADDDCSHEIKRYLLLAWRIPGTGEPGGLPSMGSHRVEHD